MSRRCVFSFLFCPESGDPLAGRSWRRHDVADRANNGRKATQQQLVCGCSFLANLSLWADAAGVPAFPVSGGRPPSPMPSIDLKIRRSDAANSVSPAFVQNLHMLSGQRRGAGRKWADRGYLNF
uniref:Uncharacterized protein n=1 Tax=Trichuris muris TaxID=70415 RepID=A0A5S6QB92_TRIMR